MFMERALLCVEIDTFACLTWNGAFANWIVTVVQLNREQSS